MQYYVDDTKIELGLHIVYFTLMALCIVCAGGGAIDREGCT